MLKPWFKHGDDITVNGMTSQAMVRRYTMDFYDSLVKDKGAIMSQIIVEKSIHAEILNGIDTNIRGFELLMLLLLRSVSSYTDGGQ